MQFFEHFPLTERTYIRIHAHLKTKRNARQVYCGGAWQNDIPIC